MRVVLAGTPDVAVTSLVALEESSHEVVGVLTRPDAPAGRGRRLRASPVKIYAEEAGIEVRTPSNLHREADVLGDWAPDVVAVVAYGLLAGGDSQQAYAARVAAPSVGLRYRKSIVACPRPWNRKSRRTRLARMAANIRLIRR